jgi:hypothetical protein
MREWHGFVGGQCEIRKCGHLFLGSVQQRGAAKGIELTTSTCSLTLVSDA